MLDSYYPQKAFGGCSHNYNNEAFVAYSICFTHLRALGGYSDNNNKVFVVYSIHLRALGGYERLRAALVVPLVAPVGSRLNISKESIPYL